MRVLEVREAVLQFSNWPTDHQVAVLEAMDAAGDHLKAARIIRQLPTAQRKVLMVKANRDVTGRHVQVRLTGRHVLVGLWCCDSERRVEEEGMLGVEDNSCAVDRARLIRIVVPPR